MLADIVEIELKPHAYDLWHDRAVFHFLTTPDRRLAYVRQVARAVRPGGHVIVSTFGPEGPVKCSGVVRENPILRYSRFCNIVTPFGDATQPYQLPSYREVVALLRLYIGGSKLVGASEFEPPTSWSRTSD